MCFPKKVSSCLDTRNSTAIQDHVEAESQPADPGQTPRLLPPLHHRRLPIKCYPHCLSPMHGASVWAHACTCGHPWTVCLHTCIEGYVAGSGRLEAREVCSGLSTLSPACPSLVHCLFTCVVLELEVKRKSHRLPPTELFRETAVWEGCICRPCVTVGVTAQVALVAI